MRIFVKFVDKGLYGCRLVVVVLRVKIGLFLCCHVTLSKRIEKRESRFQVSYVAINRILRTIGHVDASTTRTYQQGSVFHKNPHFKRIYSSAKHNTLPSFIDM